MPAKRRASAKAKARALRLKNLRKDRRTQACRSLNELAAELSASSAQVPVRDVVGSDVERLVRRLQTRARSTAHLARLRDAAKLYLDNGGRFSVALEEPDEEAPPAVPRHRVLQSAFELNSKAFMLTYNGLLIVPALWTAFRDFVVGLKDRFGARGWAACLEQSLHASGGVTDRHHLHAYLLWTDGVGVHCRDLVPFVFQGLRPRVDVCTSQAATTSPKSAAAHGLWYVRTRKNGTVESDSNYDGYKPQAVWLQQLFQDKKLTHESYLEISARDFPVGHASRKRDVDEVLLQQKRTAVDKLVAEELSKLKANGRYFEPRSFAEVDEFVNLFRDIPQWRRPILLILGATGLGKSMLAAAVLCSIARVLGMETPSFAEVTVEGDAHLDFSDVDVEKHAGVLLDGVGDVLVLKTCRETLQGRPKVLKGARSATMKFSYPFTLTCRAVVVTMDMSAVNIHLLSSDHWLSDRRNILQLRLMEPAWQQTGFPLAGPAPSKARDELMRGWTVDGVVSFLKGADLAGPAATFYANGVSGQDFAHITEKVLTQDLRLSSFAAGKTLAARRQYLEG